MLRYLVLGTLALCLVGCGPRSEVAKDKVIAKIDELLGKLDVQQKKIEMEFDKLKEASEEVRVKRIESKVRLEALQAKKDQYLKDKAELEDDLKKLQPMLKSAQESGSYEQNGRTFSIDQLKAVADSTIMKLKKTNEQLDNRIKMLIDAWSRNLEFLKKQDDAAKEQLAKLELRIEEIKSKKSAIDAVKEASSIGAPGTSISTKFDELNKGVDELMTQVETTMRVEEAKLDERMADLESTTISLDELLKDETDASSTLSEIDALLGGNSDQ